MYYTQQPVQFMYNPQAAVYPAVSSGAHDYQQVNLQSNYYAPNAETSSCNCGYDQTYGYATCAGCNYECADCNKGCSGNSCYSGCGDCNSGHGCCQSTEWNSNKNNNNNNMHSNSCHAHGHHHNHNHHHSHQNQKSVTVPASSNIPYSGTNALSITPQSKELGSPRVSQAPDQSPNIRPLQSTPLPSTIHLLGTLGGPSRASQAGFGSIDARVNQFSSASQPNSTPQMQPLNMHNLGQTGNQPQFQHELRLASTPQSAPMGNENLMFASNNRPGFSNSVNEMSPKSVNDMSPRSYFLSPTNHSTGYGLHTPSGGSGSPVHSLGMNRDDITVKTRGGSFLQNIDSHGIISAESEIFQPDRGDSFQNSPSKMHLARQSFGSASRISPRSARHANRVVAQVPLSEDIMNKFSAFDVVERCRVGQALRNDIVNHFRDVCIVHPEDVLIEFDRMKQKVIHAAFEMPTGLSEAVWDTLEGRSRIPVNPESMIRELIKVDQSV